MTYSNFVQSAHVKVALCHLSGYTGHFGYLASVFLMGSKWSHTQTTFEWIHLEQLHGDVYVAWLHEYSNLPDLSYECCQSCLFREAEIKPLQSF